MLPPPPPRITFSLCSIALLIATALPTRAELATAAARFNLPTTASEDVSARTETTKRFRVGDRFAEVARTSPLHYWQEGSGWQDIVLDFHTDGQDLVADEAPFAVRVSKKGIAIGDRDGAQGALFSTATPPAVDGIDISAPVAGSSLTWHWTLSETGLLLESEPITRPHGKQKYDFSYDTWGGFAPFVPDDNGGLTNGQWIIGAPVIEGADGNIYPNAWWEVSEGSTELILRADDRDLPKAAYPYRIDPNFDFGPALPGDADYFRNPPFNAYDDAWESYSWALTDNGYYARANNLDPNDISDGLYVHNFGFTALHPDAVIKGIQVVVDADIAGCSGSCQTTADCITEKHLYLTKNGSSVVGEDKYGTSGVSCWPVNAADLTFGDPNDIWGPRSTTTWSAGDLGDPNFGVILSTRGVRKHGSNAPDARVDVITVKVWWELPAGALAPEADSYISAYYTNNNYGSGTQLYTAGNATRRTLVWFDPNQITDQVGDGQVLSATLNLFVESAGSWASSGNTLSLHRITNAPANWTEGGVTWNCPNDTNTGNGSADCAVQWNGGSYDPNLVVDTFTPKDNQQEWAQFDVTGEIQAFLASPSSNQGWLIKKTDEGQTGNVTFTSRQGEAGYGPWLAMTVAPTPTPTYTPVPPTATRTLTRSPTYTVTRTATGTATITRTPSATQTFTPTVTRTPTQTATGTATVTNTPSVTNTVTSTVTATPTQTATNTPTVTNTVTPTVTDTPSVTETPTAIVTDTVTYTETPTDTPTSPPTFTETATVTNTPSATDTVTPTVTETPSVTETATETATEKVTCTETPTETPTPTPTNTVNPTEPCCLSQSGVSGCSGAPACETCVCGQEGGDYSYCCTTGWDAWCAEAARTTCQAECACPSYPAPANDLCQNAIAIDTSPFSNAQVVVGATSEASDPQPQCASGSPGQTVWYQFTAASDGPLEVDSTGSDYDTVLSVYGGGCEALTPLPDACNDDTVDTAQSRVIVAVQEGQTYWILVSGSDGGGRLSLLAQFPADITPPTAPKIWLIHIHRPSSGTATVYGEPGSVEGNATVQVVNSRTGSVAVATAGAVGDFTASIGVEPGDVLWITAVDASGNVSDAVSRQVGTLAVAITDPIQGAFFGENRITVRGTYAGEENVGIRVNGVLAVNEGGVFIAHDVPVEQVGANDVVAVITDGRGDSAEDTISVISQATEPQLFFDVTPSFTYAPAEVGFRYLWKGSEPIANLAVDFDGDGQDDIETADPAQPLSFQYTEPGMYSARLRLTDAADQVYEASATVRVVSQQATDVFLRSLWDQMAAALVDGDLPTALSVLTPSGKDRYASVFEALMDRMPQIISGFSALQTSEIGANLAEYAVNRTIDGEDRIFLIYFVRDQNGVWRLDSM